MFYLIKIKMFYFSTPFMKDICKQMINNFCPLVPWFPKTLSELDRSANKIIRDGSKLDSDHPVSAHTSDVVS